MAFCRLVFPLLVLSIVQCYASVKVQVPVYLWGDLGRTSVKSNPLLKLSGEEFSEVLQKELQNDPFTVIFIEETLSVEDLSRKNTAGEITYPYLQSNIADSLYLPSVENPLRVLNEIADPKKVDHVRLTENGLSAEIERGSGKFLFITLKDAKEGESRSDLLRRHNDFMEEMYSKLQERYGKVVAIYTAHYPSWTIPETHSRVRRQAQAQDLEGLRMVVKEVIFKDGSETKNLSSFSSSATFLNETEQNTTLRYEDTNVTLNFITKAGYWYLNTVTVQHASVTEELQAVEEVFAITGFSYRCAQAVSFSSVNESRPYSLTLQDLKIQPYFIMNSSSGLEFGDSFNCVGFFSAPIWASLFVVFILLSITFYGIMMMMDIRTMDRFDDPKGKTITINAGE